MTESQFIIWLKGFMAGKEFLSTGDIAQLKATLKQVGSKSPWTSTNTNESFPSSGKQILHG